MNDGLDKLHVAFGCCIWSRDSKLLNSLQIALNKVRRKVWNLPSQSHIPFVPSVSSVYCIIYSRFMKFYKSGLESKSTFVSQILMNHLLLLIHLLDTILGLVTLT